METYLRTNKIVMSALGLWPYQAAIKRKILRISLTSCALCLHVPILIKLFEVRHNFERVLVCLPMSVTSILFYVASIFLLVKSRKILNLLNCISKDFKALQSSEAETEILHKSSEEGRFAVTAYAVYIAVSTTIYCGMSLVPPALDILLPLNESRQKIYLAEVDYVFIDADDYYYFTVFQTFSVGSFVIATLIVPDMLLFSYIQHACGMFRVLWYRLHKIKTMKDVHNDQMYRDAVSCVKMYNNLLEFTDEIDSCFSTFLFIEVGITIMMMSFQGAMIIIKINDPDFVIGYGTYYMALITHLLYISIPGQKLQDHSIYVVNSVYDMKWYEMPLKIQKLLLLMMMRGLRKSEVTIGKIFILCIETFSSILKIIFQYLSVLTSMRS